MGTENKTVEQMQCPLRELFATEAAATSRPPYLYGRSTHNQRIEYWWCILRKHHAQFWMNMFQRLKDEGLFDGSLLDKSLVQFCFGSLVQNEMDQVVREWNAHKISKSRNSIMPCGRPRIMLEMPSLYNAKNCLIPVPQFALEPLLSYYFIPTFTCCIDFPDEDESEEEIDENEDFGDLSDLDDGNHGKGDISCNGSDSEGIDDDKNDIVQEAVKFFSTYFPIWLKFLDGFTR
ncbi:unnamed protein product [Ceutorhynchus assimilis]|uniref:Integrase core domain-containing protein n=1 Tax=Ceutorhynchus assimilis TaxID=467358 RepID=A0A9N9MWH8_9CUCU|nr:unnamed protein product [Ceutorhynchus assimilis]